MRTGHSDSPARIGALLLHAQRDPLRYVDIGTFSKPGYLRVREANGVPHEQISGVQIISAWAK